MCERRLLRELKPRWQMTQRIRPVDEEGVAEEEGEGEHEEGPSQGWESSGEKKEQEMFENLFSSSFTWLP